MLFSVFYKIVLITTVYISIPLQTADPIAMDIGQNMVKNFHYFVLYESEALHPNCSAWKDGFSTKQAAALQCVSKKCNEAARQCIDIPRQQIINRHASQFTIRKNSILFNKYGQWCGLGIDKADSMLYILFGNESTIHSISIKSYEATRIDDHFLDVVSLEVECYNQCRTDATATSLFLIRNNYYSYTLPFKTQILLINPDQKELYAISFKTSKEENKYCRFARLQKTVSSVIHKIFALSKDHSFWHCRQSYDDDAIIIERNIGSPVKLTINLDHLFFKDSIANYDSIATASIYENIYCNCTTGSIDPHCQNEYNALMHIYDQETVYFLKQKLYQEFAQRHIIHRLENNNANQLVPANFGEFYANARGGIIIKKKGTDHINLSSYYNVNFRDVKKNNTNNEHFNLAFEHKKSAEYAQNCFTRNNVFFYKHKKNETDISIQCSAFEYFCGLLDLHGKTCLKISDTETILTAYIINMPVPQKELFPWHTPGQMVKQNVSILFLHDTNDDTYSLLCWLGGGYDFQNQPRPEPIYTNSLESLVEIFSKYVIERKHYFFIKYPKNAMDAMESYLQTLNLTPSELQPIQDIQSEINQSSLSSETISEKSLSDTETLHGTKQFDNNDTDVVITASNQSLSPHNQHHYIARAIARLITIPTRHFFSILKWLYTWYKW